MNYRDIQKLYPKSWKELVFFKGSEIIAKMNFERKNIRTLYTFFDNKMVWCSVGVIRVEEGIEKGGVEKIFKTTISFKPFITTKLESFLFCEFDSRDQAEIALFHKAFEILENKLK